MEYPWPGPPQLEEASHTHHFGSSILTQACSYCQVHSHNRHSYVFPYEKGMHMLFVLTLDPKSAFALLSEFVG